MSLPPPAEATSTAREYLGRVRDFYESSPARKSPLEKAYRKVLARHYRHIIPAGASVLEIGCGRGGLLELLPNPDVTGIDLCRSRIEEARIRVPHGRFHVMSGEELDLGRSFDFIIIPDTINEAADAQAMLEAALKCTRPDTRLVVNFYNTLWKPLLGLASTCGIRTRQPLQSWLSGSDVENLLSLSGWELIRKDAKFLLPLPIPFLAPLVNRFSPLLPWFCLTVFEVARPLPSPAPQQAQPSVSVIVPARNEAGNIAAILERVPNMGAWTELIFVEGGSSDDTWERIRSAEGTTTRNGVIVSACVRQKGRGKGDAVREGFAKARGDVLMILDADLTVPPEELPKFFAALASGRAEFVNGVRLVYPMEDRAMPFLNMCFNKLFGLTFSWLMGQSVKDTLCGTKVLYRRDYESIAANRAYFGEFDPFGDFDLLFGASKLNLKIADLPVRYKNRTYGTTNISRFRHGLILMRMIAYAAFKLKFV